MTERIAGIKISDYKLIADATDLVREAASRGRQSADLPPLAASVPVRIIAWPTA
jgi:hypothetical protein